MELQVTELYDSQNRYFDEIPENKMPINVIKKVQFEDSTPPIKPMIQSIPRVNAKMVRPTVVPPTPQLTYEDILLKMGMVLSNGKLQLVNNQNQQQQQPYKQQKQNVNQQSNNKPTQQNQNIPKDSYIYNKYFKEELQPQNNKPATVKEYKEMLIQRIIQNKMAKVRQSNHRKLVMPNSNINVADVRYGNANKLFTFSQR
jgi:hypothetical protein